MLTVVTFKMHQCTTNFNEKIVLLIRVSLDYVTQENYT